MTRVSGVLSGQLREEAVLYRHEPALAGLLRDAAERIDEQEAELYELREMLRD